MPNSTPNSNSTGNSFLHPLVAWAFSFGCIVGWGAFVMPATKFLPAAGPAGTAIAFAIGTIAVLVIAANYGYMIERYPGIGGVYTYTRTAYGANHAFICSWCLVLAYAASIISNTTALALVARSVVGDALQFGFSYTIAGYDVHFGEVFVALVVALAVAALCVRGIKATGIVQTVLAVGMLAGVVLIAGIYFASPETSLSTVLPAFGQKDSGTLGILAVMTIVPFAFVGFETISYEVSECRIKPSSACAIMIAAILCGTAAYLVLNTVTAAVIPDGYSNWAEYTAAYGNAEAGIATPTIYAGYLLAGKPGLALFGATALCAVLTGVIGFYTAASRLVYAMAADGATRPSFAKLHATYKTPVRAITVLTAAAFVLPFLGRSVLGWFVDLMSLGAIIAYAYTSVAAFSTARKGSHTAMMALGILGLVISCLLLVLLVIPLPGFESSLSKESYVILVAWVALGVNFYKPSATR